MNAERTLHLAALLGAFAGFGQAKGQGLDEHIHLLHVEGISSTLLEKQCEEALLAFDPGMVVVVSPADATIKFKTMHELPMADVLNAIRQFGLTARLDVQREHHDGALRTE